MAGGARAKTNTSGSKKRGRSAGSRGAAGGPNRGDRKGGPPRPPFLPRLGWYFTGIALVALVEFVHPDPGRALLLGLGNDRVVALLVGLVFGLVGASPAAAPAWARWQRVRLPA